MKKRVFILIIAAGIFYTFLSAAEKNNYEQQKADFKSMLELYKNKLRKYHNNNKKTDPYKYPLYVPEKEDLIYIYDEEGKNNYYLEHTIHKEIEEIWDDNGRIKVVSWMPKWAYDIYWSSKKKVSVKTNHI